MSISVERSRARLPTGLGVPLLSFALWRLAQAAAVLAFGGNLRRLTFTFDAGYYLQVLRDGYVRPVGGYRHFSDVAFFPGLAWLTDVVQLVVRNETAAGLITCNALALAAFVAVWGAARAWTGSDVVARRVVIALALFPTSYYLWMYYSEAMLLATGAGAAWAARREKCLFAVPLLALAATARMVGVLVGPVLALTRIIRTRRVDLTSVLWVASSALGFAAVLAKQQADINDPLGWMKAQRAWGRDLAPPWQPLGTGVRLIIEALPHPAAGVGLDLTAVVVVGLFVALLWRGSRRLLWPQEPAALAGASWLIPICSVLVSSQIRFALASWPILLVPAEAWPRLPHPLRVAIVTTTSALSLLLLWRLSTGRFTA
jgi:hypothetical protein